MGSVQVRAPNKVQAKKRAFLTKRMREENTVTKVSFLGFDSQNRKVYSVTFRKRKKPGPKKGRERPFAGPGRTATLIERITGR